MTTVTDAIKCMTALLDPEAEISNLKSQLNDLYNQRSELRSTIRKRDETISSYGPGLLAVKELNASRSECEWQKRRLATAVAAHESAMLALKQHTTSMVSMYNQAAGHVLFGTGTPPDLLKIRLAIEAALSAMAKDGQTQFILPDPL